MHVIVSSKSHIGLYKSATHILLKVFLKITVLCIHSTGGSFTMEHSMSRHFLYPHTEDIAKVSQKSWEEVDDYKNYSVAS